MLASRAMAGDVRDKGSLVYPAGPRQAPADLATPTRSYKLRAWLAMLGLLAFVALYFALTGWFAWTAVRLVRAGVRGGPDAALGFIAAVPSAFFALFLAKGLWFIKRGSLTGLVEVTEEEQRALFIFLNRIADDAGAPRPHRVFLSPRVNAGVFFDLSLMNLLVPTKKNIEIGLGLVNTLTLGELKAVLAHEFGHFAQRTMTVGRWFYISQQIAGSIVAKRDALDRFLMGLSHSDIRIAWIGWVTRLVVWSIRAVLDTAFTLVVIAERSLAREMEFNADLVAVSLTGSDALIHALHKLGAADQAWDDAVRFAAAENAKGRRIGDIFPLQTRFIEQVRRVIDDEAYGRAPALPDEDRAGHRVFKAELGQPPRMWSTHPPNREREDNAKRRYVEADPCDESAWSVFSRPDRLRAQITAELLDRLSEDEVKPAETTRPPLEETLAKVDERFARPSLDRRYHGVYLGRSPMRHVRSASDAYAERPKGREGILAALAALYPADLREAVEGLRELHQEHTALEGLRDGVLSAPGGVIRHRGKMMRGKDLPKVIAVVGRERDQLRRRLSQHDRACRAAHVAAAGKLGQGWKEHLKSLSALLHYAAHSEANVDDAAGKLGNVFAVVTADGRVSSSEMTRLVAAAEDVHDALSAVARGAAAVHLPPAVAAKLSVESWAKALPKALDLGSPYRESMGAWLKVIDSWVGAYSGPLGALRQSSLDALLEAEDQVARAFRDESDPGPAPEPALVPGDYPTLLVGEERPRQKQLDWWDRFQVADGLVPSIARFAVAGAIVAGVVAAGGRVGSPEVVVYNGLRRAVVVRVGDGSATVASGAHVTVEVGSSRKIVVEARTAEGQLIESFEAEAEASFGKYVYDVAAAAPFVEWTAVYGTAQQREPQVVGAVRWRATEANDLFVDPPTSQSGSGSGTTRLVLAAAEGVAQTLATVPNDEQRSAVVLAHARWDALDVPTTMAWLTMADDAAEFPALLAARLSDEPNAVPLLRIEQDHAGPDRAAVCARHIARADAAPDDADLRYLRIRCLADRRERDEAYLREHDKARTNPWLAQAAAMVMAERGDFREAESLLHYARAKVPALAHLATEEARIRRLLAADQKTPRVASVQDLTGAWWLLDVQLDMEKDGDAPSGVLQAYRLLARGEVSRAVAACGQGNGCDALLRLAAASDGAPEDLADRALALGDRALHYTTVWTSLALAKRRRADPAPYLAVARKAYPGDLDVVDEVLAFSDEAALRADPKAFEAKLATLQPFLRGEACLMAVILLGKEAPPRWRTYAKALLFTDERPYLR